MKFSAVSLKVDSKESERRQFKVLLIYLVPRIMIKIRKLLTFWHYCIIFQPTSEEILCKFCIPE